MVTPSDSVRRAAFALAVGAAYFGAARLGLMLDAVEGFATLVWAPTGIALAALLRLGTRLWPAIALGAFAVNFSVGAAPLVASGIAIGNTLEAVVGAYLLRRLSFHASLARLRDVSAFLGAVLAATPISATLGVVSLLGGGVVASHGFWAAWLAWLMGDMIGALIVAPLILVWSVRPRRVIRQRDVVQALLLGPALVAVAWFVFAEPRLAGAAPLQQAYLVFPFLIWAALSFGQRGAVTAMFAASVLAIWGATLGAGPFSGETLRARLMLLQAFMGITAATVYVLGAALMERRRALETQEEFLAIVSHDLRNPLSAIEMSATAISSTARREGASSRLQSRAEAILRACTRMAILIRDLLDLGAMQHGRLRVEPVHVDVRRLFEELVPQLQPLAEQKRQMLDVELPQGTLEVLVDRTRITQALTNLVSNAIKFTPEAGQIVVSCAREQRMAAFSVRDSGPGLAAEEISHLFEPYWQAKPSAQGVGLGLAIAKAVVDAHGGRIRASTNLDGPGSTFTFTMPLAPALQAKAEAAMQPRPSQP